MNQELLEQVLDCPRLPSLPTIAIEVIDLCRRQDINIKQIAGLLSNDPALSSKILRTVNSSYYGLSQSVSTISHAIVILGLNSVKTLALGFSLISTFKEQDGEGGFDMIRFWQRCLYAAVGARTISQAAGSMQHEEAFLGGLLQDVGVMALIQTLDAEYLPLIEEVDGDHHRLWKLERQRLGADHAEIGARLAEAWKLPPILVAPVRFHEQPDKAPGDLTDLVRAVTVGSLAADVFIHEQPSIVDQYFVKLRQWFGFDQNRGEQLLDTIGEATRSMARLFDLQAQPVRNAPDILAQANETLLQLSLQTQQNARQLEDQNRELKEEARRDPLTGLANRGRFDRFVEEQFSGALAQGSSLGLIFADADHFKAVNDTHGHQTGDQVLIQLADLLRREVGDRGMVARYGGEEFALVLPGVDLRETARLAERIRLAVESTAIACDEGLALRATMSLGVAALEGGRGFERAVQVVAAADKAVYAAKHAGRNCVRVFVPRPAADAAPEPASAG